MDLRAKSELVEKMKEDKVKLKETSTQVDYPISVDSSTQTVDPQTIDTEVQSTMQTIDTTYCDKLDDAIRRLEQSKQAADERCDELQKRYFGSSL